MTSHFDQESIVEEEILKAFCGFKQSVQAGKMYYPSDEDKRIAKLAAQYSESELRHATVMRAAYRREMPSKAAA